MQAAVKFGMPFNGCDWLYNTRLAQELGLWAASKNRGSEFHEAAFKAYFVDGKNISDIAVLTQVAGSIGLPVEKAAEVLQTREFGGKVDADWELSAKKSISAVPTIIVNNDRLVGAQTYETLADLMASNGVPQRGAR